MKRVALGTTSIGPTLYRRGRMCIRRAKGFNKGGMIKDTEKEGGESLPVNELTSGYADAGFRFYFMEFVEFS